MKTCDLASGAAKLALSLKQLGLKWEITSDTWDDATARRFHEECIVPLTPDVKQTLEAVGRLAEVLDRASRDVNDDVVY
ncbi:hypothetical protein N9B10_02635 [Pirellulales bacterium]|nr:hypothetical protein [Pirellulales bacterium]